MKRDRYVSLDADTGEGYIITVAAPLDAESLTVNAAIGGSMRVSVLDSDNKSFPGFDDGDYEPIRGDSLHHPVKWKRPLKELSGETVRIQFMWTKGRLFSFDLK